MDNLQCTDIDYQNMTSIDLVELKNKINDKCPTLLLTGHSLKLSKIYYQLNSLFLEDNMAKHILIKGEDEIVTKKLADILRRYYINTRKFDDEYSNVNDNTNAIELNDDCIIDCFLLNSDEQIFGYECGQINEKVIAVILTNINLKNFSKMQAFYYFIKLKKYLKGTYKVGYSECIVIATSDDENFTPRHSSRFITLDIPSIHDWFEIKSLENRGTNSNEITIEEFVECLLRTAPIGSEEFLKFYGFRNWLWTCKYESLIKRLRTNVLNKWPTEDVRQFENKMNLLKDKINDKTEFDYKDYKKALQGLIMIAENDDFKLHEKREKISANYKNK